MTVLAEGEAVELTGIVQLLREPLVAPLTGEPCVAHVSRARVYNRLDHLGDLVGEIETFEVAPFALETPSAVVRVVDKPTMHALKPAPLAWVDFRLTERFLARRGLANYVRSSFFEHAIVRVGEQLTVSGVIAREADAVPEMGFRDLRLQTQLTGYGRYPLTLRRGRR